MRDVITSTQLVERASKAVAHLESAASMLRSTYFEQLVERAVHAAVQAAQGDWLDRKAAAAYCNCSLSEIDRVAGLGALTTYRRAGTPLFKRSQCCALIESGTWPKRARENDLPNRA